MEDKIEKILDSIYRSYGTDSGILLGIKDKQVVKAIVEFTVSRCEVAEDSEIKELYIEKDLLIEALKKLDKYLDHLFESKNRSEYLFNDLKFYQKTAKELLTNLKK